MICIKDKFGNTSELFPGDEIKVIRDSGKESTGKYLGECYKYYKYGHWYFSSETHDNGSYCDYYYPSGSTKYLSIDESAYGKQLRISDASASTRIDETHIKEIIVLKPINQSDRKKRLVIMDKLQELVEIANKEYDGHFTLFKFTTDWACCFGTIDDRMKSYYMAHGNTMEEAIDNCIKDRVDIYNIDTEIKVGDILGADLYTIVNYGTKYLDHIRPKKDNHYSKRMYKFLAEYPEYRFVLTVANAKSLRDVIFTMNPELLLGISRNGEIELNENEYLEGYSLETVITPKKQFTKRKFRIESKPCIVKDISHEFWKNYITYGEDYFKSILG